MKRIILDQMQRRWLILAALCLVQFICGLTIPMAGEDSSSSLFRSFMLFPFFMMAFILGPNLWLSELQQGYARIALMLPLTARQIGRIFWWLSVGFATLLLAVFSLLGAITAKLALSTKELGFDCWLSYVAASGVLLGALFWGFSGTSSGLSNRLRKMVGARIYNFVQRGCFIGGVYFLITSHLDTNVKFAISFPLCAFLTILGWFRAERMIVDRGECRLASQQPQNSRRQFAPPAGYGGIPFVFQTSFIRVWGMGLWFLVVFNILNIFEKHSFDWHHLTRALTNGGGFGAIVFGLMFLSISKYSFIVNLRFLRTLPVSTARLVAVLLGEAILPLLTVCLAMTALAWHETGSAACLSWFKIEFLGAASVSIFIAVTIWNTQATFNRAVILGALILGAFAPAIYEMTYAIDDGGKNGLSWGFVAAFTVALLAGAHWATCRILARSSSAYRVRQNPLATQQNLGR
jgi:hypothetical protein